MNYLAVENLTKSFGEKLLFENISFGIESGQKIGLIAKNGAGKSSLIKIITGEEDADSGRVTKGNNVKISYLSQNPEMKDSDSILDYLFDSENELIKLIHDYEDITTANFADRKKLDEVVTRMDELQAWGFESGIKEILSRFNITNLHQPIAELSGGMRKKVALAKALVENVDLIILDEPTNHLDVSMIEWLENYLSRQNLSLFVVTHDRYFLDNICNEIYELENQTIYKYKGNYSYFLEKKAERLANDQSNLEKAQSLFYRELEWMRRQPQARATKAKAREDSFYTLQEKVSARQDGPLKDFDIQMQRLGGKILELNNVHKSFGDQKILEDFTYTFKRGDRIGIIGKNGTGKSTLLRIIMGEERPDRGKIITGKTVEFGYFQQEGLPIKGDKRIIEIIKDIAEEVEMKKGSMSPAQFLTYFNFNPNVHYNYFSKLSGGEKRKLYLLTTLLKNPNFLILDEPTNDLDIETLNKLEEFLHNFGGCLMVVSHDRYFMDHMVDHIFAFEGNGKIKDYYGNYSEYHQIRKVEEQIKKPKVNKEKASIEKPKTRPIKFTYKQQKEFESLENELAILETEKASILEKLNAGIGTQEEFHNWSARFAELLELIDEKTDRWIEMSELMEDKD
jgi:ATP-binding cassette subfamily F protein uup